PSARIRVNLTDAAQNPQDGRIILRIDDHGHAIEVLRGGPDQRNAADVDLLDGLGQRDSLLGDRLLERVELADHHVDGGISMAFQRVQVFCGVARQNSGMNGRVQRLDTTRKNLRRLSHALDGGHCQASGFQGPCCAPAGDQIPAQLGQTARELFQSGLVIYADDCPWHTSSLCSQCYSRVCRICVAITRASRGASPTYSLASSNRRRSSGSMIETISGSDTSSSPSGFVPVSFTWAQARMLYSRRRSCICCRSAPRFASCI